jgi:hypothetical protein
MDPVHVTTIEHGTTVTGLTCSKETINPELNTTVIFLGTYCFRQDQDKIATIGQLFIDEIQSLTKSPVKAMVYLFGAEELTSDGFIYPKDCSPFWKPDHGPHQFIYDIVRQELKSPGPISCPDYTMLIERTFQWWDCRILNMEGDWGHELYAAVCNLNRESSLFDNFLTMYKDPINIIPQCILVGQDIVAAQRQVVEHRIRSLAKIQHTQDGKEVAVVQGSDYVNLSHEALRRIFSTNVTMVFWINSKTGSLKYSIRTWDASENAKKYASVLPIQGGGPRSAGGELPYHVPFPW